MPIDSHKVGMRMDGLADVDRVASHLHGEADLADQVARMGADDAAAEQAVIGLIEQQFGESLVAPVGDRATRCGPRKHGLAVLDALRLALLLGHARPRDLRIGVSDRRDLACLEHAVLASRGFRRDMCLVHGLVRQHRLADDVADGKDVRHVGAHLLVDCDEAAVAHRDARLLGVDLSCRSDCGPTATITMS
jgi:hypothetical protein